MAGIPRDVVCCCMCAWQFVDMSRPLARKMLPFCITREPHVFNNEARHVMQIQICRISKLRAARAEH